MQVMSFQEQSFHVAFMPDGAMIAHNKQINPGQAAWQPGFANQGRPAPFSVELKAHVSKVHVTAGEQRLDRDPQDLFDEYHSFPKGREADYNRSSWHVLAVSNSHVSPADEQRNPYKFSSGCRRSVKGKVSTTDDFIERRPMIPSSKAY